MNLRSVATIGRFEITRYLKDKIALFTTVVMPVILVLIIGVSFGPAPAGFAVGVLDVDESAASAQFLDQLGSDELTVARYTSSTDLARDIRLGFVSAGLTVEPGFADSLDSATGTAEVTLTLDQTSTNGPAITTAITAAAADYTEQAWAVRVAVATLAVAGADPRPADPRPVDPRPVEPTPAGPRPGEPTPADPAPGDVAADPRPADVAAAAGPIAAAVAADTGAITTRTEVLGEVRESEQNGFARAVPTQLTLFIFLNGLLAGMTIVDSRRLGVSRRILGTPVGVGPHILGIGLGRWGLGLLQAVILLAIGVVGFGVNFGNWPTIVALVLVWTALAAAVGMLIGAIAKTPDQVVAVSIPLGIGFGMLGGSMWPLSVVPEFMRTLAHLTPHAWANDAWLKIVDEGATLPTIGTELAVLIAMTVALATLAVLLLRRALSR